MLIRSKKLSFARTLKLGPGEIDTEPAGPTKCVGLKLEMIKDGQGMGIVPAHEHHMFHEYQKWADLLYHDDQRLVQ